MCNGLTSPREPAFNTCSINRCGDSPLRDDEVTSCFHTGCSNEVLCEGCSYDCVDCTDHTGQTFCYRHISQSMPDAEGMVTYRCFACQLKFDAMTNVAA